MNINNINKIINDILKDTSKFDIIREFKSIKNLCRSIIEMAVIQAGIEESNKNNLINNLLNQVIIKNESITDLEREFQIRYNKSNNYKKLIESLNALKLFPKKKVSLTIDDFNYDIEVYYTKDEYIPTENDLLSQKVLEALKNLKKQEEIERIADLLENGIASIYLDPETKEKVEKELIKRKLNKKNQDNDFIIGQMNFLDKNDDFYDKETDNKEYKRKHL